MWISRWRWLPPCRSAGQSLPSVLKIKSFLLTLQLCSWAQIISSLSPSDPLLCFALCFPSSCPSLSFCFCHWYFVWLQTITLVDKTPRLFIPTLPWNGDFRSILVPHFATKGHSSPILIQNRIWNLLVLEPQNSIYEERFKDIAISEENHFPNVSTSQAFWKDLKIIPMIVVRVMSS